VKRPLIQYVSGLTFNIDRYNALLNTGHLSHTQFGTIFSCWQQPLMKFVLIDTYNRLLLTTVTKKTRIHPIEAISRFRDKLTSSEYDDTHGQGRG
jgi:hypothetical protein